MCSQNLSKITHFHRQFWYPKPHSQTPKYFMTSGPPGRQYVPGGKSTIAEIPEEK